MKILCGESGTTVLITPANVLTAAITKKFMVKDTSTIIHSILIPIVLFIHSPGALMLSVIPGIG